MSIENKLQWYKIPCDTKYNTSTIYKWMHDIDKGIKEYAHGYHNGNTNQEIKYGVYVKVREYYL